MLAAVVTLRPSSISASALETRSASASSTSRSTLLGSRWEDPGQVEPALANARLEASILFTSDAQVHELNRDWREKDKPTNVLSFPMLERDELVALPSDGPPVLLGDIALAQGGFGGVVIAGGLGYRIRDTLAQSGFAERFRAKGRFEKLMSSIPVKIITHPQPGLFGAAAAFAKEHLS